MSNQKLPITLPLVKGILELIANSPSGELLQEYRISTSTLLTSDPTLKECWDHLIEIGSLPDAAASKFVKMVCNINDYYFCDEDKIFVINRDTNIH